MRCFVPVARLLLCPVPRGKQASARTRPRATGSLTTCPALRARVSFAAPRGPPLRSLTVNDAVPRPVFCIEACTRHGNDASATANSY